MAEFNSEGQFKIQAILEDLQKRGQIRITAPDFASSPFAGSFCRKRSLDLDSKTFAEDLAAIIHCVGQIKSEGVSLILMLNGSSVIYGYDHPAAMICSCDEISRHFLPWRDKRLRSVPRRCWHDEDEVISTVSVRACEYVNRGHIILCPLAFFNFHSKNVKMDNARRRDVAARYLAEATYALSKMALSITRLEELHFDAKEAVNSLDLTNSMIERLTELRSESIKLDPAGALRIAARILERLLPDRLFSFFLELLRDAEEHGSYCPTRTGRRLGLSASAGSVYVARIFDIISRVLGIDNVA